MKSGKVCFQINWQKITAHLLPKARTARQGGSRGNPLGGTVIMDKSEKASGVKADDLLKYYELDFTFFTRAAILGFLQFCG